MSCGNCGEVTVTLKNHKQKGYSTGVDPWIVEVDKRYKDKTNKPDRPDGKYKIEWTIEANANDLILEKARIDFKGKTHFGPTKLEDSSPTGDLITITTSQIADDVDARDYVYDATIWFKDLISDDKDKTRRILIDPGYRVRP